MATYLYCVLTASTAELPPASGGVGGAPVRVLPVDDRSSLEAWVATLDEAAFRVTGGELARQVVLHNEIVSAALATGRTPLPARFGSYFPDDDACLRVLGTRVPELRASLARLAGLIEMSVLVVPPRPPVASEVERQTPGAGRRYLEELRERARRLEVAQRRRDDAVRTIGDAVRDLARGETHDVGATGIISIAHLLRREDVTRYREVVRAIPSRDGIRLIVAGPRAPYSFVEASAFSIGHDSGSPDRIL